MRPDSRGVAANGGDRETVNKVTLILCIHNHQPVGNLPGVFEHAYRAAYLPFLNVLEAHPGVKFVLHNTGPLLEWYEEHAPDYIERVRAGVRRGQIEVLTGGFYEPILSTIPARDAAGQIAKMSEYTRRVFGAKPRGMWLAERVWEPHLARTIGEAGVEYVPLDDYEFRLAGIPDEDLVGHFVTESEGVPLSLFPISKRLRYVIPFGPPEETIALLRGLAERGPGLVAVFGDDGEKFGVWPGTHEHVYAGGWLERFLVALEENDDWIETSTFAEHVDRCPSRGRAHLPTSSYPEMMEWALPTRARRQFERFRKRLQDDGLADEWGPFVSGGIWKGFLSKYDEANLMVRKMVRVSDRIAHMRAALRDGNVDACAPGSLSPDCAVAASVLAEAENELWRGQCNCAYWHGVFGGLYLPHLRAAIYEHLIRAENLLDSERGTHWDWLEACDHDLDGREEVLLESHWANAYVAPARGGTLFELDLRRPAANLLGVMSRYDEAYHRELETAEIESSSDGTASIHEVMPVKEKGLSKLAVPDDTPRRSAVDRFVRLGSDEGAACLSGRDVGDFAGRPYAYEPFRRDGSVGVAMIREAAVGEGARSVTIEKTVTLRSDESFRVDWKLSGGVPDDVHFVSEWNLAFMTPDPDYLVLEAGSTEHHVKRPLDLGAVERLVFHDRLRGERISIVLEPACGVWVAPLETVSQSEGGYERVFQGVTVAAHWTASAVSPAVTLRTEKEG